MARKPKSQRAAAQRADRLRRKEKEKEERSRQQQEEEESHLDSEEEGDDGAVETAEPEGTALNFETEEEESGDDEDNEGQVEDDGDDSGDDNYAGDITLTEREIALVDATATKVAKAVFSELRNIFGGNFAVTGPTGRLGPGATHGDRSTEHIAKLWPIAQMTTDMQSKVTSHPGVQGG